MPSLIYSINGVRNSYLSNSLPTAYGITDAPSNNDLLNQIVQAGIKFQEKQTYQTSTTKNNSYPTAPILSFPNRKRVSGCIATVHLKTALIPILENCHTAKDPNEYCKIIEGTADAMHIYPLYFNILVTSDGVTSLASESLLVIIFYY